MATAFKEWAVVVELLARGQQILILRKGGIHEGRKGFQIDADEFFLFPTLYHQQDEFLTGVDLPTLASIRATWPGESLVPIGVGARLEAAWDVQDLEIARRLRPFHAWNDSVVEQRFDWGKTRSLHVLAVRAFRLRQSVNLPMLESYGGCKSWIRLEGAPAFERTQPALSDDAFGAQLSQVSRVLGTPQWKPSEPVTGVGG